MARVTLPPITRSLLITLISLTLLNAIIQPEYTALGPFTRTGHGSPYLSLLPGQSWKYPWTFVTASFVEQNVFGLLVSGLTLFYGGRYLERAWSSQEYAKFILIVGVIPNVLCFMQYIILFSLSGSEKALTATISGSIAIQSAFLVSFKQLVPEHTVSILKGVIRMRVKHFPALHLLANTLSGLLLGTETAMFLSWLAFFTSWTYLRFYRRTSLLSAATGDTDNMVGDASDTFAFAYFFPEPIHTPIAAVADQVWNLLVQVKICTPFSAEDVESGNEQAIARAEGGLPSIMTTRGSGRREEAERRRALALRALDQRLHAAAGRTASQSPGPSSITVPAPSPPVETKTNASASEEAPAAAATTTS